MMARRMSALYDITVAPMTDAPHTLDAYRGKVLLIVNTASKCGFTPQFEGLEALHKELGPRGLVVLGFPCNQFGGQDPGSNEEIAKFCTKNYGVSFAMHQRIEVNGSATHPLFKLLKSEQPGLLGSKGIKWNFTKFLVDPQGRVVDRIGPKTTPKSLRGAIERLLPTE